MSLTQEVLISTEIVHPTTPPKRGRPRKYATNAEKQVAYRNRVNRRTDEKIKQGALLKALAHCSDDRGKYMTDAPHGKGLLVSGGYDPAKVEQVQAAHERSEHGGRKKAQGHAPTWKQVQSSKDEQETQFTFMGKIRFPKRWKLSDAEKEEIVAKLVRNNFEIPDTSTATEWNPETKTYDMIPGTYRCRVCEARADWWHEAVDHFITAHAKLVPREVRSHQPWRIS